MDLGTLDYTLRRGLAGLVRRLDALAETSLDGDQRMALTLATTEARQLLASIDRAAPDESAPAQPVTFDDPPTVLIVDDNPTNTALLSAMLKTMGIEATSAGSGAAALAEFESAPPDLVFMDVMLPDDDGITVTGKIRERYGDAPYVVGVSALPNALARAIAGGMDAFVAKPVRLSDVSDAVEGCLDASH